MSWAEGIVSGDRDAIKRLIDSIGENDLGPFPVLPRHTLKVHIAVGAHSDPEMRRIQLE